MSVLQNNVCYFYKLEKYCIYVYTFVWGHMCMSLGALGSQKKALDPLGL